MCIYDTRFPLWYDLLFTGNQKRGSEEKYKVTLRFDTKNSPQCVQ